MTEICCNFLLNFVKIILEWSRILSKLDRNIKSINMKLNRLGTLRHRLFVPQYWKSIRKCIKIQTAGNLLSGVFSHKSDIMYVQTLFLTRILTNHPSHHSSVKLFSKRCKPLNFHHYLPVASFLYKVHFFISNVNHSHYQVHF